MALCKLVRSNYGGKSPVSIKHENLHSFKERVILLCHSILETRRISRLHGSALFTIPLRTLFLGKTWLGVMWLAQKQPFLVTQIGFTFLPQKAQIGDPLNRILIFLTAICLLHSQLCTIIEGTTSLTQC